jgi:DNA modification methylase
LKEVRQVIERAVELYTNEKEIVLTPFLGVGSEAYVAVKKNRHAVGIELKQSYYMQAVKNLEQLEIDMNQLSLI